MDYKQQVIGSADEKFQQMLAGTTKPLIDPGEAVDSSDAYSKRRDQYVARVSDERKRFNNAIMTINKTRKDRLRAESQYESDLLIDKSTFRGALITTIIFVLIMAIFVMGYLRWDFAHFVEHDILNYTGESLSEVFEGEGPSRTICAAVAVIVGIIIFIVFLVKSESDNCLTKLIGGYFVGAICGAIVFALMHVILFLLGYVAVFLLKPVGVLVLTAIAILLDLKFAKGLITGRYKTMRLIVCLICAGVGGMAALVVM